VITVQTRSVLSQTLSVGVVMLAALAAFRFGRTPVAEIHGMLQDDAFYYLQIAKNLGSHGASSFNMLVSTNGYHPLWLVYLACYFFFTGGTGVEVFMIATVMVCAAVFYLLAGNFLRTMGSTYHRSNLVGLGATFVFIWLARTGMEVMFTLPLSVWLATIVASDRIANRPKSALVAGFASSAVVLSRLDSAILVALMVGSYFAAAFVTRRREVRITALVAYCFGLTPTLAYFLSNVIWFGTLLPVSGQAKQLNNGVQWSNRTFVSLLSPSGIQTPVWSVPFVVAIGVVISLGAFYWAVRSNRFEPAALSVLFGMVVFPLVYFVYLSSVSDWRIWPWYRYPLLLTSLALVSIPLATLRSRRADSSRRTVHGITFVFISLLVIISGFVIIGDKKPNAPIVRIAERLVQFQERNRGAYAMGDAAGTFGYYSTEPVVHLEGLVMDKPFLDNISEQRNVVEVMREYNVTFYVGNNLRESDGCYEIVEPRQGGSNSRKMTGTLCDPPVLTFTEGAYSIKVFKLREAG